LGFSFVNETLLSDGRREGGHPTAPNTMSRKHTILVADDDDMVRSVMRTLLKFQGYHVEEAVNGRDALQKYQQNPSGFDLVMMDLNMPALGGREALQELQRLNPDIKAVLLTGGADDPGARGPAVRFLQKPFENTELFQLVGEMLPKA